MICLPVSAVNISKPQSFIQWLIHWCQTLFNYSEILCSTLFLCTPLSPWFHWMLDPHTCPHALCCYHGYTHYNSDSGHFSLYYHLSHHSSALICEETVDPQITEAVHLKREDILRPGKDSTCTQTSRLPARNAIRYGKGRKGDQQWVRFNVCSASSPSRNSLSKSAALRAQPVGWQNSCQTLTSPTSHNLWPSIYFCVILFQIS